MADRRSQTSLARGVRNNNPGNLVNTADNWTGKVGSDGKFVIFSDSTYGVRALFIDMVGDIFKDGLNTLYKFFQSYAPKGDNNDPKLYAESVGSMMGVNPSAQIPNNLDKLFKMIQAIIYYENGTDGKYITDSEIAEGIEMALQRSDIASMVKGSVPSTTDSEGGGGLLWPVVGGLLVYFLFIKK